MPETLYIRDARSLERLAERLAGVDEIGLDTEFMRERTYYPRLCLLQLSTTELLVLVDPFAVEDLQPLWERICGGATIVLHAGEQDLEIIQRLAGGLPEEVFDTQIAAAFLGLGHSVGYSKLIENILGEDPGASEAYTDWSRRPLTPEQREYALDDVRYLLACAAEMRRRLRELGRLHWVREETRLKTDEIEHTPEPREQWRRVKGGRGLRGRELAILQELAAWREQEAIRRDEPRRRIAPDRVLVQLAKRRPKTVDKVAKTRGLHPREAQRSGEAIVATIATAVERPRSEWPEWPRGPRLADDPNVDAVVSLLDAVLRARAQEMDLATRLMGTRSDLGLLVRLSLDDAAEIDSSESRLLRGWRRQIVGDDLLALLRGDRRIRVGHRDGLELIFE